MGVTESKMQSRNYAEIRTSGLSHGLSGFYTGNGHKTKLPSTAASMKLKHPSCSLVQPVWRNICEWWCHDSLLPDLSSPLSGLYHQLH